MTDAIFYSGLLPVHYHLKGYLYCAVSRKNLGKQRKTDNRSDANDLIKEASKSSVNYHLLSVNYTKHSH